MPKLVLFDIDGTLLNSTGVDADCYVKSIMDEFDIRDIDDRWETYRHTTDSSIFEEIFERAFSRKPSESETRRHIERLVDLFIEHHSRDPGLFEQIGGAGDIVNALRAHPEWEVGIATGAWKESALFKLRSAKIDYEGIPLATGSDAMSREEILQKCIGSCKEFYAVEGFEKTVSIGDGIWDVRTACNLGLAFIRLGASCETEEFGEFHFLTDYRKQDLVMKYLEEARQPVRSKTAGP